MTDLRASVAAGFASITGGPALLGHGISQCNGYVEYVRRPLLTAKYDSWIRDEQRMDFVGDWSEDAGSYCRFLEDPTNKRSWRLLMLVKDPGKPHAYGANVTQRRMQIITRSSVQRLDLRLECLSFPTPHPPAITCDLSMPTCLRHGSTWCSFRCPQAIDFLTF